jgi:hypothetical protein
VGFDSTPARYFMAPFLTLEAYFFIRYAVLDTQRSFAESKGDGTRRRALTFSYFANCLYGCSMLMLPMLLIVPPMDNVWGHTLVFHATVATRVFVVLANFNAATTPVSLLLFACAHSHARFPDSTRATNLAELVLGLVCDWPDA